MTKRLIAAALALFPLFAYASLDGLWTARRDFGPDVRGRLRLTRDRAEIAGRIAPVKIAKDVVTFELPNAEGRFRGVIRGDRIVGHWVQPSGVSGGSFATPVTLTKTAKGWSGVVQPLDDHMTLVLPIRGDSAFLHNPERNIGRFIDVQHIAVDGPHVKLLGGKDNSIRGEGVYDAENEVLSIYIGSLGNSYDFHRTTVAVRAPYVYREPQRRDDGWQVGTLDEAGISTDAIAKLIDKIITTPMDSMHASDVHALLIARHGKLVLEEYFHGTNPDEPHDTRSAAKSLTSILVGAANVPVSTPVYAAMGVATEDPRKQAMTLANLLMQNTGLDCDDNDDNSPGNENTMQQQTVQPDWWKYTLDLKNIRPPGEKSVYCSCQPNLAGGVLSRKTGRWLPDLFRDLVAEPMQIRDYALFMIPAGDGYMGGGVRLTARDFVKLAQVVMDGGRWHGRQIFSEAWARRSVSPLTKIGDRNYGYLWWLQDYPYRGKTVRAFFAAGNGGQISMGVPELDLVIVFNGGNYGDAAAGIPQRVYIPEYILPAVK